MRGAPVEHVIHEGLDRIICVEKGKNGLAARPQDGVAAVEKSDDGAVRQMIAQGWAANEIAIRQARGNASGDESDQVLLSKRNHAGIGQFAASLGEVLQGLSVEIDQR